MGVFDGADLIDVSAGRVAAFHGVCVCDLEMRVEDYSSASFFGHVLVPVLGVHVVLAEGTADVVELRAVQS